MKPVSRIEPIADIPEVTDYPRDIQPIWDEHCISCHDYDQRAGGVILTADRGPIYSHSYFVLTQRQEFTDGRDAMHTNLPPRAIGTSASPLMKRIDGSHRGVKVTKHQEDLIRYWIEVGAPYPGTYAALGTGMIGGFPKSQLDTSDRKWPQSQPAAEAIERRCLSCHDSSLPLPKYLSDNLGLVLSNPDITEIRVKMSRHIMFNLTRPEKSLILLAPLAMEQGGYALCKTREGMGETVVTFDDTSDPDYQKILALCVAGKRYLDQIKRFDMPGFTPRPEYVREMKRFGIVPPETPTDAVDPYAADRVYWESLWYRPDTVK